MLKFSHRIGEIPNKTRNLGGEVFMRKKIIAYALTLAMAMTISALPTAAFAEDSELAPVQSEKSFADEFSDEDNDAEELVDEDDVATEEANVNVTNVKCVMKSTTSVRVSWSKVSGASEYQVYRADSKDSGFDKVKTVGASKSAFTNKKLKPGRTHYYKVTAITDTNEGEAVVAVSAVASVKTPKLLKRSTAGFSKTNAGKIISVAKTKLGCPYVAGAEGPNAFDCSGFVYWVYKKAGVAGATVKRTSAGGIYSNLKKYSIGRDLSKAQPGDIVLFGSGGGIRHAAIYYGDYKLIHASNGSVGVCITGVGWSGGQAGCVAILRLPNLR